MREWILLRFFCFFKVCCEIPRILEESNLLFLMLIKTYYLSGYDLIKVDNSSFSNKLVNSTVWRAAKVQNGYMVLGQYFSSREKNVSDMHQMEVLSASVNNFSPPSNLLSSQLSNVSPANRNKKAKILVRPNNLKHVTWCIVLSVTPWKQNQLTV